jgi:hypothetical protein
MPKPDNLQLEFRDDTNTFLPTKIDNQKRLEWLRRKNPQNKEEARAFLMNWFNIGKSKAYELLNQYEGQLVSV